jgi:phosphoglycolate phosphatase
MLLNNLPKAVIFDFDNTLVDTLPTIHTAFNETLEHFGYKKWSEAELRNNLQFSPRDSIPKLMGTEIAQKASIYYLDAYKKLAHTMLMPLNYAVATLDYLKGLGIPLYIVSNKRGILLRYEIVELLKWGHYFENIIGSEDCPHDKPHPVVVQHALGKQASKAVWFVGDSDVDIACAINAGCTSILIKADTNLVLEYEPTLQYSNLSELLDTIKGLERA